MKQNTNPDKLHTHYLIESDEENFTIFIGFQPVYLPLRCTDRKRRRCKKIAANVQCGYRSLGTWWISYHRRQRRLPAQLGGRGRVSVVDCEWHFQWICQQAIPQGCLE